MVKDKEIKVKTFEQLDKKDAPNIHKMLSSDENKLRIILLNIVFQSSGVVDLSEITSRANDAGIDVASALKGLKAKGLTAIQNDGCISGIYPFSALALHVTLGAYKDGASTC